MHIANYITYLQYEKGVSKHTLTAYKNDLHQFELFIQADAGSFVLENIDTSDIRRWTLHMMSNKMNPTSVARKISTLNSFYKYCMRHEIVEVNPAASVILPKKSKRLPSFLKKEEIENLFSEENNATDFRSLRDDLILEMLVGLGLRRSELVNLKLNDIDYGNRTVKILGKRNKERIIPAYEKILVKTKIYIKSRDESFPEKETALFLTNKGKPIYDKFVYLLTKKYIAEVSTLKKRSPHVLRHTYATLLLNEGADLEIIRELLGHSSLASTQVYTHNSFEQLKRAYKEAHPRMKKDSLSNENRE